MMAAQRNQHGAARGQPWTGPAVRPPGPDPAAPGLPGPAVAGQAGPGRAASASAGRRASRAVSAGLLPAADAAALATAVSLSGRPGLAAGLYALAVLAVLAATGQHRLRICLRVADQAGRFAAAAAVPAVGLLPWLGPGPAIRLAAWSAGLILVFRLAASAALRAARRRGRLAEPALVIGAGTFGAYLGELMATHPELGLAPAGYLDDGPPRRDLALPSLGRPADLPAEVAARGIRRVIVCPAATRDEDLVTIVRAGQPLAADICVVPRLYELAAAIPLACLDEIWGIPLIPLRRLGHSVAGRRLKRLADVAGAAVLLAVTAPLLIALTLAVRLTGGRPPLFRQDRVTGRDRTAAIVKLRTLAAHGDADTAWTAADEHATRLGRWLRRTHLDELPQLGNVLRGDMSLVGPRPERPYFAERFGREIPRYADRARMPAGLTGWAQVHGLHGDTSIFERARFDNQYIEYWSPWLDTVILARTLGAALAAVLTGSPR